MMTLMEALRVQEDELQHLSKAVLELAEDLAPLLGPEEERRGDEELAISDCDAVLAVKMRNRTIALIVECLRAIRARLRVGVVELEGPAEEEVHIVCEAKGEPERTRQEALAMLADDLTVWPLNEEGEDVTPYGWEWQYVWSGSPPILVRGDESISRSDWDAARAKPASLTRDQAIARCRDHMAKGYIWPSPAHSPAEPVIPSPMGWWWDWRALHAKWVLQGDGEAIFQSDVGLTRDQSDVGLTRDQAIAWCRRKLSNGYVWPVILEAGRRPSTPAGWWWTWCHEPGEWVIENARGVIRQSDVDVSLRGAID